MDLSENFALLCQASKSASGKEILETLLVKVRDVNETDEDGHTPLWYAAIRNPHLPVVEVLTAAGAKVDFAIVSEAVINNPNPEIAKHLYAHLKAVTARELDLLFLLCAASNTTDELIRFFVAKGANPNTTMPMDLYLEPCDDTDDIDFDELWNSDDQAVEQNALVVAMYENPEPTAMLESLLSLGVDPNAIDSEGYPVLVHALDNAELVRVLLDGGAKSNVVDSQGMTPLMHACAADNSAVALILLGFVDDLNRKSFTGETALHYALGCHLTDNYEVVKALLAAGCDMNEPDADGLLPLDIARFNYCSEEIVELLIAAGAHMGDVS